METIEISEKEILDIIIEAGNYEQELNQGYSYLRGVLLGLITRLKKEENNDRR